MSDAISDLREFELGQQRQRVCSCGLEMLAVQSDLKIVRLEISKLRQQLFTASNQFSNVGQVDLKLDCIRDLLERIFNDFLSKQPEEKVVDVPIQSKKVDVGF